MISLSREVVPSIDSVEVVGGDRIGAKPHLLAGLESGANAEAAGERSGAEGIRRVSRAPGGGGPELEEGEQGGAGGDPQAPGRNRNKLTINNSEQ